MLFVACGEKIYILRLETLCETLSAANDLLFGALS